MPSKLASSLLTVDTAKMHHIDTRNAENLYSMWSGKDISLTQPPFLELIRDCFSQSSPSVQNQ